jgi:hypothetical protein
MGTDAQPRSHPDPSGSPPVENHQGHQNYSARQANAILGRTGLPFWQDESYDRWVRTPEEFARIVRYIERNPATAGLVKSVEDWRWSSAFGRSE